MSDDRLVGDVSVRPFDPADTNPLRELFAQSIEYLTGDAYNDAQRLAWLSAAQDGAAFENRLWDGETIVLEIDTERAGFVTLKPGGVLDMLYVHPYQVRQGVGRRLLEAVEARARCWRRYDDGRCQRHGASVF